MIALTFFKRRGFYFWVKILVVSVAIYDSGGRKEPPRAASGKK